MGRKGEAPAALDLTLEPNEKQASGWGGLLRAGLELGAWSFLGTALQVRRGYTQRRCHTVLPTQRDGVKPQPRCLHSLITSRMVRCIWICTSREPHCTSYPHMQLAGEWVACIADQVS